jgi:hypothetical protein
MTPPDERRKRIEAEANVDLTEKSEAHLLADIHDESERAPQEHAPTTRTLARFASLLVVLSRKADANSKRLERYTAILIFLTAAIVFFAAVQIAVGVLQAYFMLHPPK